MGRDSSSTVSSSNASPWIAIIVVGAATAVGALVLCVFVVLELVRPQSRPITSRDRAVLITAGHLEEWTPGLLIQSHGETLVKKEQRDETIVLEYQYNHPEPEMTLSLACTVVVKPTAEEAQHEYETFRQEGRRKLRSLDAQIVLSDRDADFRHGDTSHYAVLGVESQYRGAYFVCQEGRLLYRVALYGDPLDEDVSFPDVVAPTLRRLKNYDGQ